MVFTCPRCKRSLSTADNGEPPQFCMFCGQKLVGSTHTPIPPPGAPPVDAPTLAFVPQGTDGPSGVTDPDEVPLAPEPAPKEVGGYKLGKLLGSGGMGAVYEAEAPGTGDRVAVKLLSSRLSSSASSVERFRQEGRLASQLAHPRCVFVLA
ncbi:MAG: hypothetical protein K2V38_07850, partial [Gemmataceae bacterium]|nr:hypothetical protein [Gemmataceae bacterium]